MRKAIAGRLRLPMTGAGFWLFLILAGVYLLTFSGAFHAIDEVSVAAMTESLVKHGSVSTDQIVWSQGWTPSQGRMGPDGHLYSKKGIASALAAAPFYWLALQLPGTGGVQAMMLANAFITALTGWLLYRAVLRLRFNQLVAVLAALGFGLGTMAWPYARYLYAEPITACGLMLGFWGLLAAGQTGRPHYAVWAGLGAGIALLAKTANAIAWPLFLLYFLWILASGRKTSRAGWNGRALRLTLAFLAPLALAGLGLLAYNMVRTGQPFDAGYSADETFSTPLWLGLAGLFLSPGKSLFLYSPLLLAALLGIRRLARRDRPASLLALGLVLVYPLLYGQWFMWWGGWSWGPRFLVPILPFLCLFLAPVIDWALRPGRVWARAGLAGLAALSLAVQLLGVSVDFNQYLKLLYGRGIDSAQAIWRIDLSALPGHWNMLRTGPWDLGWMASSPAGPDWPRLLWPLALLAFAAIGWRFAVAGRGGRTGRAAGLPAVAVGMALMAASAMAAVRLPAAVTDWETGCDALSNALQPGTPRAGLPGARPGDVMIVDFRPYADQLGLATDLLERYKAGTPYWGWVREEPVPAERAGWLSGLGMENQRVRLLLETTPEGDPASTTERWLDAHAFRIQGRWLSPAMRLVDYELPRASLDAAPQTRLGFGLDGRLLLAGYSLSPVEGIRAGDVISLSLFWQAQEPVAEDYVVFVQMLDENGKLRVQQDRQPVAGFWPTSRWEPGQMVQDNYGLALPDDLPPGRYRLIAGLYSAASGQRLGVSGAGGSPSGDFAPVAELTVESKALR